MVKKMRRLLLAAVALLAAVGFCEETDTVKVRDKCVEKENVAAANWYRKAAEQGLSDAQFRLAGCYIFGKGVGKDGKEAVRWLRKAAAQGHSKSQEFLRRFEELERNER